MMVYTLVFLVSCFFSFFPDLFSFPKNKSPQSVFLIPSATPLFFIEAKRDEVGADYVLYKNEFNYINSGHGYVHSDVGFQVLNKLVACMGLGYHGLFTILALLLVSGVYAMAASLSLPLFPVVYLFIVSFNYLQSFSLIAQYTAISFLCFGFACLFCNKKVFAIFLFFLAGLLHSSAFIFLCFVILYFLLQNSKRPYRLCIISLIFVCGLSVLGSKFIPVLLAKTRFAVYYTQDNTSLNSTSLLIINVFVFLMMALICLMETSVRRDIIFMLFFVIQCVGFISALLQSSIPLMVRMVMYFSFFQIYAIPYSINKITKKSVRYTFCLVVFVAFLLWFIIFPISGNYYEILPYKMY